MPLRPLEQRLQRPRGELAANRGHDRDPPAGASAPAASRRAPRTARRTGAGRQSSRRRRSCRRETAAAVASARTRARLPGPERRSSSTPRASIVRDASTPTTSPSSPTWRANSREKLPGPQARSRTTSPAAEPEQQAGDPHLLGHPGAGDALDDPRQRRSPVALVDRPGRAVVVIRSWVTPGRRAGRPRAGRGSRPPARPAARRRRPPRRSAARVRASAPRRQGVASVIAAARIACDRIRRRAARRCGGRARSGARSGARPRAAPGGRRAGGSISREIRLRI